MAAIQEDFDRIALLEADGWSPISHYHNFLLRHVPRDCKESLEIGCGTGAFSRLLAERSQDVLAFDLSPEMIRIAQARSPQFPNIEFQVADVSSWQLPAEQFDCIATIATLHHLPLREMVLRMKDSLKLGGVLLVLDLFEREGFWDMLLNMFAIPVSVGSRLIHNGRLLPPREVHEAWAEHERSDTYPTFSQVCELCADILPAAKVRKHLLWRYSIIWQKPDR